MIKTTKSDNEEFVLKAGTQYQFGINKPLCGMILDGLMKTGQVLAGESQVFDHGNISEERMPYKPA